MNVLVLNGSPKGQKSITLMSVRYLEKCFPADRFNVLDVGQQIRAFENENKFNLIQNGILSADLVLISYPVYTFLATAQLHRCFEIMKEQSICFDGKTVTQLTTSKRFFDVTAHSVVKEIIGDLAGAYIEGLSADMEDLLSERGRKELTDWWKYVRYQHTYSLAGKIEKNSCALPDAYISQFDAVGKKSGKKVLVVTDSNGEDSLDNMTADFVAVMPYEVETVNLHDIDFKCGCLGCLKCAQSGACAVHDGFDVFLNERINTADAVIMAFTIKNHAMSALYKTYYDRQFVNGHRPVNAGKPTGYIISGNLRDEFGLQMYVDAKAAVGGNLNCGIVTDECDTSERIRKLAERMTYALENSVIASKNFYEVGGMRIFRDMIWIMRGLMKADYDYYKKNNLLDFPQKKRGQMLAMKFVGRLMKSKAINKKMPNMMSDGMLMGYEKAIKEAMPLE